MQRFPLSVLQNKDDCLRKGRVERRPLLGRDRRLALRDQKSDGRRQDRNMLLLPAVVDLAKTLEGVPVPCLRIRPRQ
jgi:hypothetical protein